ncbi:neurotrophin 1-like [Portunus trituberculatus]|uniref:neurotrophin 1-like n=1 Tax=Portunus trituberculatus TaxID=210409 RepID=UPI001E1CE3A2|nr:neurotrophin 1-like [Portunus trituberculatus]
MPAPFYRKEGNLESGALDHSAILTYNIKQLVLAVAAGVVRGEADAKSDPAYVSHHGTPHHSIPAYHPTTYAPTPAPFHHSTPAPAYHPATPPYHHPITPSHLQPTPTAAPGYPHAYHPPTAKPGYEFKCYGYDQVPTCSYNTTKPWCLYDYEYPLKEMEEALHYFKHHLLTLYADLADLYTGNSVNRPKTLTEETYLCPSETAYVRPLRAINTEGYWRTIVNNVKVDYEVLTQTTRVEECQSYAECPLVPQCYKSKCLQKFIYHRFLVYDPCDEYFPFAVETFQLPASCACLLGASTLDH